MLLLKLPNNILSLIFLFDNTYHEKYNHFINNYNDEYKSLLCEKCNTFTLKINSFFFEINKSNNIKFYYAIHVHCMNALCSHHI